MVTPEYTKRTLCENMRSEAKRGPAYHPTNRLLLHGCYAMKAVVITKVIKWHAALGSAQTEAYQTSVLIATISTWTCISYVSNDAIKAYLASPTEENLHPERKLLSRIQD